MHIKLSSEGTVVFGSLLIKTSINLVPITELIGHQLEGNGATATNICCYDDAEATEVMSILQGKGIEAELVQLVWDDRTVAKVEGHTYVNLSDAQNDLLIIDMIDIMEANEDVPFSIVTPPESMGELINVTFACTEPTTGMGYSRSIQSPVTYTTTYLSYRFLTSGDYEMAVQYGGCRTTKEFIVDPATRLTGLKQKKIQELDTACNQSILAGFKSWALGSEYTYDFDYEAQINFSGTLNAIATNMVTDGVIWKTREKGPLPHTITQFKKLFMDGMLFKQQTIGKYWQLKTSVLACKDEAGIAKIQW